MFADTLHSLTDTVAAVMTAATETVATAVATTMITDHVASTATPPVAVMTDTEAEVMIAVADTPTVATTVATVANVVTAVTAILAVPEMLRLHTARQLLVESPVSPVSHTEVDLTTMRDTPVVEFEKLTPIGARS
jgi:hypothetical protein